MEIRLETIDRNRFRFIRNRKKSPSAFTLIELLIVVMIIAILAAIALPNFRDAQIRARIAATESQMHIVTDALELYRIDHNTYVYWPSLSSQRFEGGNAFCVTLTTPIAYLTSCDVIIDPCRKKYVVIKERDFDYQQVFEYGAMRISDHGFSSAQHVFIGDIYILDGAGPDGLDDIDTLAYPNVAPDGTPNTFIAYAASNGLLSVGDIYRVGGKWRPKWLRR